MRWTGDLSTTPTSIANGALGFLSLVVPGDYEQSTTLEQGGVTLMRTRMSVSLNSEVAGTDLSMAVMVLDEAHTPTFGGTGDPGVFAQLISGNVLWHRRMLLQPEVPFYDEVDIRVRRLLEETSVHFVLSVRAGGPVTLAVTGRCLIKGG